MKKLFMAIALLVLVGCSRGASRDSSHPSPSGFTYAGFSLDTDVRKLPVQFPAAKHYLWSGAGPKSQVDGETPLNELSNPGRISYIMEGPMGPPNENIQSVDWLIENGRPRVLRFLFIGLKSCDTVSTEIQLQSGHPPVPTDDTTTAAGLTMVTRHLRWTDSSPSVELVCYQPNSGAPFHATMLFVRDASTN